MIDEGLYRETFSGLRASGEAKEEVLLKMNERKTMRRPMKALRALALAAMLTLALAVTAYAASGGALFRDLRIIWQDGSQIMLEDDDGNQVLVTGVFTDAELRDGRLVLTVDDTEIDITEDIEEDGAYSATVESADGRAVEVSVTGTLEDWDIRTSFEDGDADYHVAEESGAAGGSFTTATTVTVDD